MIETPKLPRFLEVCAGEKPDASPVWLMRQAGRYLPEYRHLREKYPFLTMVENPELAAQVTLMPLKRFPLDAAILFSDLLPPLQALGLGLEFVKDEGPRIPRPIRSAKDVDLLPVPLAEETLGCTFQAIKILRAELDSLGVPLVGFGGAPFTLAAYAIEGSGSKSYDTARTFMLQEPSAWQRLMKKLTAFQGDYLAAQARAGVQALQIFDSWVGILGREEYVEYVQPHNQQLFRQLKSCGVPLIHFTTRTSAYIEEVQACGADILSVDAQLPLDEVQRRSGARILQGNLEPLTLLAPWEELRPRVDRVLDSAKGLPGHIFNLGHGLLPSTDPDQVARLVDYVHEKTAREVVP